MPMSYVISLPDVQLQLVILTRAVRFISFRACFSRYRLQPLDCIIFSFVK